MATADECRGTQIILYRGAWRCALSSFTTETQRPQRKTESLNCKGSQTRDAKDAQEPTKFVIARSEGSQT